jgi:hypothetical protein
LEIFCNVSNGRFDLLNASSEQGVQENNKLFHVNKRKAVNMGDIIGGGCSKNERRIKVKKVKESKKKQCRKPTSRKIYANLLNQKPK